jgi:hypothetical protein
VSKLLASGTVANNAQLKPHIEVLLSRCQQAIDRLEELNAKAEPPKKEEEEKKEEEVKVEEEEGKKEEEVKVEEEEKKEEEVKVEEEKKEEVEVKVEALPEADKVLTMQKEEKKPEEKQSPPPILTSHGLTEVKIVDLDESKDRVLQVGSPPRLGEFVPRDAKAPKSKSHIVRRPVPTPTTGNSKLKKRSGSVDNGPVETGVGSPANRMSPTRRGIR